MTTIKAISGLEKLSQQSISTAWYIVRETGIMPIW